MTRWHWHFDDPKNRAKRIVEACVICVLLGIGIGFFAGYAWCASRISIYEIQKRSAAERAEGWNPYEGKE